MSLYRITEIKGIDMQELINFATGRLSLGHIEKSRADRVRRPALAKYLQEKREDGEWMARTTIKMLDFIALEPEQLPVRGQRPSVSTVSSYLLGYGEDGSRGEADGPYSVAADLHAMVNPLGFFCLDRNSPLVPELVAAIQKNISGKHFKAALMYRRTKPLASRILVRIREKGSAARSLAYSRAHEEMRAAEAGRY